MKILSWLFPIKGKLYTMKFGVYKGVSGVVKYHNNSKKYMLISDERILTNCSLLFF